MNTQNSKLYKCYKEGCYFRHDHPDGPYLTQMEYDALITDGKLYCPENNLNCGIQELKPEDYPKKKDPDKKKLFIFGGIILSFLIIVGGVYAFINHQKNKIENAVEVGESLIEKSDEIVNELSEKITDLTRKADLFFEKNDYEKAKIAYNEILAKDPENLHAKQYLSEISKIIEQQTNIGQKVAGETNLPSSSVEPKVKEPKTKSIPPPSGNHTKIFSDGSKYVGEFKNGKLHGSGTYYYGSRQLISKKDLKERYAESGDYLSGEWFEGNVVSGKLFDRNNNVKERIIIGR